MSANVWMSYERLIDHETQIEYIRCEFRREKNKLCYNRVHKKTLKYGNIFKTLRKTTYHLIKDMGFYF